MPQSSELPPSTSPGLIAINAESLKDTVSGLQRATGGATSFTSITTGSLVAPHPLESFTVTVYEPAPVTVMLWVAAPLLQT